jgi:CHAD domain-containing protein
MSRFCAVNEYGAILVEANFDQLHALRVDAKKLRYVIEFFVEPLGSKAENLIGQLKILQDHLGAMNDAVVACSLVGEYVLGKVEKDQVANDYLLFRKKEADDLVGAMPVIWGAFNPPEFRRTLLSILQNDW